MYPPKKLTWTLTLALWKIVFLCRLPTHVFQGQCESSMGISISSAPYSTPKSNKSPFNSSTFPGDSFTLLVLRLIRKLHGPVLPFVRGGAGRGRGTVTLGLWGLFSGCLWGLPEVW